MINVAGEFKDYKRGPGFWFLWALVIGSDISKHPYLKARFTTQIPGEDEDDLYAVINDGLTIYERINRDRYRVG